MTVQPLPIQDVFARWHMDILAGLPKTQEGYQYILLLTNSFSHWAEAFPLKTQEAQEINFLVILSNMLLKIELRLNLVSHMQHYFGDDMSWYGVL
jgi:hypothetical protein